jgi:exoribonuclease R
MTEKYKVINNEGKYSYALLPDFKETNLAFEPSEKGLFFNDIFSLSPSNKDEFTIEIIHSSIRSSTNIPGVLIINGNKTYGRGKNGKLLYKCVPDDNRLQPFLIPYEIKHVEFSKVFINLYVTFSFSGWESKHPHGLLTHVIGPVNELDNFYEYQLYCKSLNNSIQKFQKDTAKALHTFSNKDNNCDPILEIIKTKFPEIDDRTKERVYTIDPRGSVDLDDGFSIIEMEDGVCRLSIYIANVTVWIDVLDLWDSFSRRISTIYLPDKKRPMLPTVLSDSLCSLLEKQTRVAFTMDIFIKNEDIIDIQFSNCFVRVKKNFVYDEPALIANDSYQLVLKYANILLNKYKYINSIRDSHDLVAYLMILMNYNCAKEMMKHNNGIFRSSVFVKKEKENNANNPDANYLDANNLDYNGVPENVGKFIRCWKSSYGQYINLANDLEANIRHETLNIDAYIHITSPIRRLVDLLNIIKFQKNNNMIRLSENATIFYDKWLNELEYINTTMRSIRKVQTDCDLLTLCSLKPDILETEYNGYLFDNIPRNDGLYQYIVYLPDLNLTSRINLNYDISNYTCKKFKIYIFEDEDKLKKKIRLHLVG